MWLVVKVQICYYTIKWFNCLIFKKYFFIKWIGSGDGHIKISRYQEKKWGKNQFFRIAVLWVSVLGMFLLGSCNSSNDAEKQDCIIQCSADSCVTLTEFSCEISLKLAAYPYGLEDDPDQYNQVIIDLAATLAEQCQLLCGAKEKGIRISSEELKQAETSLLEGYSDQELEQLMIEKALRYQTWKRKLEQDFLIRRFIQSFLVEQMSITQEEISKFYDLQIKLHHNTEPEWIKNTKILMEKLKAKKAQENYEQWMEQLKASCPVSINRELLRQFLITPPESKEEG